MKRELKILLPLTAAVLLTGCGRDRDRNDHAVATTRHDSVVNDAEALVTDAVSDGAQLASNAAEHGRELASDAVREIEDAADREPGDGDYRTDENGIVQSGESSQE